MTCYPHATNIEAKGAAKRRAMDALTTLIASGRPLVADGVKGGIDLGGELVTKRQTFNELVDDGFITYADSPGRPVRLTIELTAAGRKAIEDHAAEHARADAKAAEAAAAAAAPHAASDGAQVGDPIPPAPGEEVAVKALDVVLDRSTSVGVEVR